MESGAEVKKAFLLRTAPHYLNAWNRLRYHVNAKRPLLSVSNRSAGRLEYGTDSARRASTVCDFEPRIYFNQHEVHLQIDQVTM